MKSMCHEVRRSSPSVAVCRPASRCRPTTSATERSSSSRSASSSISPAACRARASSSDGGRSRLPDVVGPERRQVASSARLGGGGAGVRLGHGGSSVGSVSSSVGVPVIVPRAPHGHARRRGPGGVRGSGRKPQCSGSRCDSGVVLATVTGESPSIQHDATGAARHREGGEGTSIRKPGDRLRLDLSTRYGRKGHLMTKPAVAVPAPSVGTVSVPLLGVGAGRRGPARPLRAAAGERRPAQPPTGAMYLHELTHDARHALGVPCH